MMCHCDTVYGVTMTQIHFEAMSLALDIRHLTELDPTDVPAHVARVDSIEEAHDDAYPDHEAPAGAREEWRKDNPSFGGFISKVGRVYAVRDGDQFLVRAEPITLTRTPTVYGDDITWEPRPAEARAFIGTDADATRQDLARLFITQTIDLGADIRLFAGWRHRFVVTITEEVGPKESKTFRSDHEGNLDWEHTYNASTAVGLFSTWASELAMEFGDYDHVRRQDPDGENANVIRAFIMREAAEAALAQARFDLNAAMVMQSMRLGHGDKTVSTSQLARSLHTDRANLTRHAKVKPGSELAEMMARVDAMGAAMDAGRNAKKSDGGDQPEPTSRTGAPAKKRAANKRA